MRPTKPRPTIPLRKPREKGKVPISEPIERKPKPEDLLESILSPEERSEILEGVHSTDQPLPDLVIQDSLISLYSLKKLRNSTRDINITRSDISTDDLIGTVNDPRMGTSKELNICATCHQNEDCPGHYGRIELTRPIVHPYYTRDIIQCLTIVCNTCSALLVSEEEIEDRRIKAYKGRHRLAQLEKIASTLFCPNVPEEQRPKRGRKTKREVPQGGIKVCFRNPVFDPAKSETDGKIYYSLRGSEKSDTPPFLTAEEVFKILNDISDRDAKLMGFEYGAHPRDMVLYAIPVIPPISRPAYFSEGVLKPNYLTRSYQNIVKINNSIAKPGPKDDPNQQYNKLIAEINHLIDNTEGKFIHGADRERRGLKQKIQGKDGLIRNVIMGRRVDFSGRTVIGPDPSLKFGQIRIPRIMAQYLGKTEFVYRENREALQKLLQEGRVTYIIQINGKHAGKRRQVTDIERPTIVLESGDRVERWLQDGDLILYNRQPTLHKHGIMAYEVVLGEQLTIGLHLSYTTPHGADFDIEGISFQSFYTGWFIIISWIEKKY